MGLELLVTILTRFQPPSQTFRIYGDNTGVVEGWKRGRSRNHNTNQIFRRIYKLLEKSNSEIRTSYVRSGDNPTDGSSRGLYPTSLPLLPKIQIPNLLAPFIEDIQYLSAPMPNMRRFELKPSPLYPVTWTRPTLPPSLARASRPSVRIFPTLAISSNIYRRPSDSLRHMNIRPGETVAVQGIG